MVSSSSGASSRSTSSAKKSIKAHHHLAVISLAAQPAEKGALEQLGVETVGLGAPVQTRLRSMRG
jgi:hypothetical protein